MKYYIVGNNGFNTSEWSGGTTTEMAIYPNSSKYLKRDFVWRISSATCDLDSSDFSLLPDYDRVLMVLEGETVLSYDGERSVKLGELEQDSFDGAWRTRSFGKMRDFNLMVRKGCDGFVDVLRPEPTVTTVGSTHETEHNKTTHAIYCREGYIIVGKNGDSKMVNQGELIVLEFEPDEEVSYTIMGEGVSIRCQIFMDSVEGEYAPVEIPAEKATFDDFKCCLYLANIQIKWAEFIVKPHEKYWFDEALSSKIKLLEKLLATTMAYLLGCIAPLIMFVKCGLTEGEFMLILAIWTLADIFIVSPLIYLAVLPKPVRKHMKDPNNLTPYEKQIRDKELMTNERAEKIMRRYRTTEERMKNGEGKGFLRRKGDYSRIK